MCNFTIIHDNSSHSPSRMSNAELFGIFKKAAKLTKDPCNGCRIVVSERHFALSPRYLGRLKKGVMETLESEIGRYSESLGGVPLAYCNLQLLQQTGNILDDHPFIHFNVSFKAVIFQPTIGSILKCVVNELGQDHISCLVHNWFNLSLPLRGADAEERLPKGSKVMAKVTKIQAKNGILAIQGTPTEERFSDLPLVDPLKELSDDEGANTTEVDGAIPKKEKHDSGFVSDPDNTIGFPLESTSENDGGSVRKKKKKKEAEREQKMDDIIVKKEPNFEETMEEGLDGVTEGESRGKKKKKKKDKVKEKEVDNSPGMTSIKKEPEWSPEEIDNMAAGDGSNVEQTTEKRKKKKKKSMIESDSPIQESIAVKTEKVDSEESSQDVNHSGKKKKKKDKETDSVGLVRNAIKEEENSTCKIMTKEEIDSHNEEIIEKKLKSKKHKHKDGNQVFETDSVSDNQKHLKRKHSDISYKVNGGGDHGERTTQNEIYETDKDTVGAPPKKKKKKRKHIKEEVV